MILLASENVRECRHHLFGCRKFVLASSRSRLPESIGISSHGAAITFWSLTSCFHNELTPTSDLRKITRYLRNQQVPTNFVLTYQLALPEMIFLFFLIINVVGQARRMLRQIYQAHITIVILYSHILCILRIHSCNSSIDPFAISIQNINLGEISRRCNLSMERDPYEETTQMPALSA